VRYRVLYRLGGRESKERYGGSFRTLKLAQVRKAWLVGELAAQRVPDLSALVAKAALAPTLREATERWKASRIDVSEGTRTNDRVNTERVLRRDPKLATSAVDSLDVERWAQVFAGLAASHERGTLKKSKEAFAMVYDHLALDPNPLRDPRVKLPHARPADMVVPIAAHVEAVAKVLPAQHLLPYLTIDWTGLRLGAVEGRESGSLTSTGKRSSLGRRLRRTASRSGSACTMSCSTRSSRTYRPARTATLRRPSSPASAARTSGLQSPALAASPGHRPLALTDSASVAARYSGSRATRSPRSPSALGTQRSSPPSTTCTRSATTPRLTTRRC
jgi:hypothetical protein